MKRLHILFGLLIVVFTSTAQISVGASMFGTFKDFPKGTYKELANKTTVFVLDGISTQDFNQMIKDVWTYNDYEVITRTDYKANLENYKTVKYAVFTVEGFVRTVTSSKTGASTDYAYVYYHYFHHRAKRKDGSKLKRRTIAGVFLTADGETVGETIRSGTFSNVNEDYHNYGIGYLKNYLQLVNRELEDGGYYWAYDKGQNKKELKKLVNKTLYVPDYLKSKLNAWVGTDSEKEDPDKLFKKYDYSYEWITKNDLNEKILNAREDLFYLSWVRVNSQKFVNVVNAYTGEIIYEDYEVLAYNIKKNDISRLASKIK